jgi:hypothetical protein
MAHQSDQPTSPDWVQGAKARGLGHALSIALDVLEPLGLLGAQLLWTAQPVLGVFVPRDVVTDIAQHLETPEGIERLRQQLEE